MARRLLILLLLLGPLFAGIAGANAAPRPGDPNARQPRAFEPLDTGTILRSDGLPTIDDVGADAYAKGRYIVWLLDDAGDALTVANDLGKRLDFVANLIYTNPRKGFASRLSRSALEGVRADDRVRQVDPVQIVAVTREPPTGITRIGGLLNRTAQINGDPNNVDVDVAIVDTGVDGDHPDLNVLGGASCLPNTTSWRDVYTHGTHVAGTIGALDDDNGVVGVAPGARLWSIKVVADNGRGTTDFFVCGLQTVANNVGLFEAVNMSLGYARFRRIATLPCDSTLEHQLICDAVDGRVAMVGAAGNEKTNAETSAPCAYTQVICVSALSDSDGIIGGLGPASPDWGFADDTFAGFSNYGDVVDIMAPGIDILSTLPNGEYGIKSGTSMSTPHVTGAAALLMAGGRRMTRTRLMTALRANSDTAAIPGDPDGIPEPVLYIGPLSPTCRISPLDGRVGRVTTVNCGGFRQDEVLTISAFQTSRTTKIGADLLASASVTVPERPNGVYTYKVTGETSGRVWKGTFTLNPSITIAPASGRAGSVAVVEAHAFDAKERVVVRWYQGTVSRVLASGDTNFRGYRSFSITIPAGAAAGSHRIEVYGVESEIVLRTTFTVGTGSAAAPSPAPSPSAVPTDPPTATPEPSPTSEPTIEPTAEPTATATPTLEPTPETPAAPPDPLTPTPTPADG